MKNSVAEIIGKKARGLKHCTKLLKLINERGTIEMDLGNTGVSFTVTKGDYMHTLIKSKESALAHELNAIRIVMGAGDLPGDGRFMPAPIGASETMYKCKHCGKMFVKNSNRQVYCGTKCRIESKKLTKEQA